MTSAFVGVDVGLSREKACATIRQNFVYKMDDELDCMGIEDLKAYVKLCRNIASDRISNDTSSIGEVCVLSIHYFFYSLWIKLLVTLYLCMINYFLMYSNKYIT